MMRETKIGCLEFLKCNPQVNQFAYGRFFKNSQSTSNHQTLFLSKPSAKFFIDQQEVSFQFMSECKRCNFARVQSANRLNA